MSAYAPQAIWELFDQIQRGIPDAVLSGIVGDQAHSFGYHLARNDLPADDYSVVLPLDRQGDGGAASALDVSLPAPLMLTVTNRLLTAAKAHDPRLAALREFCGTTDGDHTHPYDLSNDQDGPLDSWDSSHLWHVHLSFYRAYSNDFAILAPIADVFTGAGSPAPNSSTHVQEDDMQPYIIEQTDGDRAFWYVTAANKFIHCPRPNGPIGEHDILAAADRVSAAPVLRYPLARIQYLINAHNTGK